MRDSATSKHQKEQDSTVSFFLLLSLQTPNLSQPAVYNPFGFMKAVFPGYSSGSTQEGVINNGWVKGTFNSVLSLLENELGFLWNFISLPGRFNTVHWIKGTMHSFLILAELFVGLQRAGGLQCLVRSVIKYREPRYSMETKSQGETLLSLWECDFWPFLIPLHSPLPWYPKGRSAHCCWCINSCHNK